MSSNEPEVQGEDFNLFLPLIERPVTPLNAGLKEWKLGYQISRDCGDLMGMARGLQNVLNALVSGGRAVEGLVCARRLLTIARELGDPLIVGHALANIASTYWVMGDHVSAFDAAKDALQFAGTLPPKPAIHSFVGPEAIRKRATDLLLSLRQSRGQTRRALADHEAMLEVHRESGDTMQVVSSMESLGLVYKDLGEYAEAVKWFSSGLQVLESGEFPDRRTEGLAKAGLLGNMGVALTNEGDTDEALRCIEEAARIYVQLSDDFGQISGMGQKGRALLQAGRVREALDCLEKMLQVALQYDALAWQQAAHYNLARAWLASGDRLRAVTHCEQAAAQAREKLGHIGIDLHWLRAALFHPRGPAESAPGDEGRFIALAYYAVDELRQAVRGSRPSVVVARWIDAFEDVIGCALQLPPSEPLGCPAPRHALGQTAAVRAALDGLDALVEKSPFAHWAPLEVGLYCLESLRAQEFQERLLLNANDLEVSHDRQLALELARVEAELGKLQSVPPIVTVGTAAFDENHRLVMREPASPESIAEQERVVEEHHRRVAELSAKRSKLALETVESQDASATDLQKPARLEEIRSALDEHEMFLEFILLGQNADGKRAASEALELPSDTRPRDAFAIVMTRSWTDVVPLGRTAAIETQCRTLLDMLERFGSELSLAFFEAEARRAFDLILRPIWNRAGKAMDGVRRLVISTDGGLSLLPLDLLVDQASEGRSWRELDYVARHFSTEYCPSATAFVDLRNGRYGRGEPGDVFVGFGDPDYRDGDQLALPGTRREIEAIASTAEATKRSGAGAGVRVFLGGEARKDALCDPRLLESAEYIHLACHGTAGQSPHWDGALFLADGDKEDAGAGVLTCGEVMRLRTRARLVVMSACESGLGKMSRGEGVQGLARAWLFAGAQSVIATMWQVDDDAAAELMNGLYEDSLGSAIPSADALVAAKRRAIRDERLACPAFWAAFVVFGGRSQDAQPPRDTDPAKEDARANHEEPSPKANATLSFAERELLEKCGHAWETAWRTPDDDRFRVFFEAARELVSPAGGPAKADYKYPVDVTFGLVANNCRVAWEHWAKERRAALAVRGYEAYVTWHPEAQLEEWNTLASAYRPENLQKVRQLARGNRLPREFEMFIDGSPGSTIVTTISWARNEPAEDRPIDIALPIDDLSFTASARPSAYCKSLSWAVFRLLPGERISITERATSAVYALEDGSFIFGGTWGSSLFPHALTIRFHPDFVPLRFQREQIGRAHSVATVRFSNDGATLLLRPQSRAWLERFVVMFRRAPGASEMFGAPGSPFAEEVEFARFEELMRQARTLAQPQVGP